MRYDTKLALDRAYNELKAKRKQNKAFVSRADELIKKIDNETKTKKPAFVWINTVRNTLKK